MTQNIYDQPGFFAAYSQLARSRQGLDGAAEWPAIRAMLPALADRRIVDLGCGFGWFCRWALGHGAAQVLGLDVSENMLNQARAGTPDPRLTYRLADLEHLDLPPAAFDLAYSSLVLHYIQDAGRLFGQIHRALVPGGNFVFSTEHPIYTAPSNPGWAVDPSGRQTWPLDCYQQQGPRTTDWLANGVLKYHRTIGTTLNLLIGAGFTIRHLEEFCPAADQIAANPALEQERHRPMFLLVAARRSA